MTDHPGLIPKDGSIQNFDDLDKLSIDDLESTGRFHLNPVLVDLNDFSLDRAAVGTRRNFALFPCVLL